MSRLGNIRKLRRLGWRTFVLATLAVPLLASVVTAAVPASAGTITTLTSPTTLSGSQQLSSANVTAIDPGSGVTATFDLVTSLNWSQDATLGNTFDSDLVRQGRTVLPSLSYTRTTPGSMSLTWTLNNLQVSWGNVGPLSLGSPSFNATSGSCVLLAAGGDETCHLSSSGVDVFNPGKFAPGPYVTLSLAADVTVTPTGLATLRQVTFGGTPAGSSSLALAESPITDPVNVPCTVGTGDEMTYTLGALSSDQNATVNTSLVFDVGLVITPAIPIPPIPAISTSFAEPNIPLASAATDIDMTGPGATFDMGAVQHNNIPPTASAAGPYSGSEGSPITFDGSGSSSVCGFPTLVWNFSDGGVAFGKSPQHTFEAPGVYSGLLTATDATGLTSTTTFSVTVANLPPVANAGPSMSSEWGVPVTLNGSAIDPGTAEQPFLTYSWNFGDGSPSASGGASVTHTYANPGTYTATFTACDPENACNSSTTQVVVTQRAATTTYTGPNTSKPSKIITLSATVADDLGQPVAGRTVTFTLGTQTITATTSSSGVATAQLKLTQKQGTYSVTASFAGDAKYTGSGNSQAFIIG